MSRFDKPAEDNSRSYMEGWFRMGDTAEGLERFRQFVYRTPITEVSPSGLMCVCQAARDALRAKDAEIARLTEELATAKQGQLVFTGGAS